MNLKVRLGSAALPSLLSLGCLALLASGVLDPIELVTLDWRFRLTPRPHASPEICVIELDQKSFSRIGQWPWPRTRHAALLDALHAAGARMVGLDILFSEQSGPTTDRALAEAMQRAGNIYLPIVFNTAPPKDSLPDILLPLEQFRVCARGLGFINFYSDSDGVNRSIPLILRCAGRDYPQLAFSMACDYLGVPGRDISLRAGRDLTLTPSGGHPIRIPLAAGTTTIINWAGRWDSSFARYSFCDVVDAYNSRRPGALLPSPLGDFKGKIVFVGLTAPGAFDSQPVPVEANYPNLGLHVNLLNSILVNRFITRMGKGWEALFVILIIVLMCRLLPLLQPLRALLAAILYSPRPPPTGFSAGPGYGLSQSISSPACRSVISSLSPTPASPRRGSRRASGRWHTTTPSPAFTKCATSPSGSGRSSPSAAVVAAACRSSCSVSTASRN
ncbi:MAG: CHASE2 domain-containing protein [Candidatus Aureabacteria bacterium]|nr:CHASE2 domain-containing protein [Candidatus Auribacterota bacterium]